MEGIDLNSGYNGVYNPCRPIRGTDRDHFDKEYIQEVAEYIRYCIMEEIRDLGEFKYIHKEMINGIVPTIPIQLYYHRSTNRLYLFYEIDQKSRYMFDPSFLYLKINSRLLNSSKLTNHMRLEIVSTPVQCFYNEIRSTSKLTRSDSLMLRANTFTYWNCTDGRYRFIEDGYDISRKWYELLMSGKTESDVTRYYKEVAKINNRYDFNNHNRTDVPKAFDEYKDLYFDTFGEEIKPIEESDIIRLFVHVYHPSDYDNYNILNNIKSEDKK